MLLSDWTLYCDLDGVLADFDGGVKRVTGRQPHQLSLASMWAQLARSHDFYASLDWMHDGRVLWDAITPLSPTILTGKPRGSWAEPQKRQWCAKELGPDIPVIVCWSKQKARWSGPHRLLIDDRLSAQKPWEQAGGTFVHHTSAAETLQALHDLGVLAAE